MDVKMWRRNARNKEISMFFPESGNRRPGFHGEITAGPCVPALEARIVTSSDGLSY
jgi:hypothetical protein